MIVWLNGYWLKIDTDLAAFTLNNVEIKDSRIMRFNLAICSKIMTKFDKA